MLGEEVCDPPVLLPTNPLPARDALINAGVPLAMELDPVEEDDDDDDQVSTAANPYGALKARYDSLLEKALRIQNFLDDFANQLERVQVRSVPYVMPDIWYWSWAASAVYRQLVPASVERRHRHAN